MGCWTFVIGTQAHDAGRGVLASPAQSFAQAPIFEASASIR
jgi:hypothetical protein